MTDDLDGRASVKREIIVCEVYMSIKRSHNPEGSRGKVETYENRPKEELTREKKSSQRDWSVVVDVDVLGYPETILSLDMTKCDQGSTATAVET